MLCMLNDIKFQFFKVEPNKLLHFSLFGDAHSKTHSIVNDIITSIREFLNF